MSDHRSAAEERGSGEPGGRIHVTQVKSTIGSRPLHRKTMKALGLAGIGRSTSLPDTGDVRGMLAKVTHLVTVEAAPSEETA